MRILAIRGCNLASLAGEFEIDLASAPLGDAGVFAIVGPTGAGKSTLLDAVCVALFDRTPRLGNRSTVVVGRGEDDPQALGAQDVRALLRRGAAAGWAEVDFESGDARRYRARWSVRRARGALDGRLQDAQHTLTVIGDAGGGERLGGTRSETLKEIQRRLGLTFDQFRRSALLAQGEFATFLRAEGRDRSELLERMTGTEIYTKLSIAAHLRATLADQRLRDQGASAAAIAVLGDEARGAAEAQLALAGDAKLAARARHAAAEAAARWVAEAERRARELAAAEAQRGAADTASTGAAGARAELVVRRRAELLRAAWDDVGRLERHGAIACGEAERAHAEAARLAAARAGQQRAHGEELAAIERALAELAAARAVAEAERRGATEAHQAAVARVAEAKHEAATYHGRRGTSLEAASKAEKAARRAHAEADRLGVIAAQADEAARVRGDLAHQLGELAAAARGDGELRARVEAARAEASVRHGERARIVAELRRAAGHAHARAELVAGEACPLCGATEHPWHARAGFDQLVVEAEDKVAEIVGELEEARGELAAIAARDGQRAKDRKRIEACVTTADGAVAAARGSWRAQLAALGELVFVDDPSRAAAGELARERTAAAWAKVEAAAAARSQAEAAATASADAQARVEQRQAEADQAAGAVRARDARLAELATEIERAHAARAAKLEARAELELAAERAIAEHEARGVDAAARADALARELAAARTALDAARAAAGIAAADLQRLLADDPARTEQLAEQLADLERVADRARTLVAERRRLADDHASARPPALDDAARVTELASAVGAADHHAAALTAALAADDDARVRRAAALARLAEAERAAELDRVLGAVIGSHDGKLFRSFAQSLTLDGLLAVANSHLDELAPRYQLERVPKHDLELQVIDRDLGGEIRSVQSLSGGESFLVSLALALGLSSMSAHDVRVRTLLIDEGFGTLDPATLDSALAVLDALQATGRQVGVISHVPALVERVGAHVRVDPRGGGKSEVSVHAA